MSRPKAAFGLDIDELSKLVQRLSPEIWSKLGLGKGLIAAAVKDRAAKPLILVYRAVVNYPLERAIYEWYQDLGQEDLDFIPEVLREPYKEWKKGNVK